MVRWIAFWIVLSLCVAWASEIVGSRITETEFVMTEGNIIIAKDIPVSTPKTLKASDCE